MAKSILKVGYEFDFQLIAIVSPLKNYRLCWYANQLFHCNFTRQKDIEINLPKKKKLVYFSCYSCTDAVNSYEYFLMANKSNGEFLIPELKEADYFFMIKGEAGAQAGPPLLESVKSMYGVQVAFGVDARKLKTKQNLIF